MCGDPSCPEYGEEHAPFHTKDGYPEGTFPTSTGSKGYDERNDKDLWRATREVEEAIRANEAREAARKEAAEKAWAERPMAYKIAEHKRGFFSQHSNQPQEKTTTQRIRNTFNSCSVS